MVKKRKQLTEKDANRGFFRLVKAFNTPERPQSFDVRTLRPGKTDWEVAEELAVFFNRISAEFDPLTAEQIPNGKRRSLPALSLHEVSARIKRFRKPKSMVEGDVFPELLTKFCDFFAMPLTDIYNEIASSLQWPASWKAEYVTIIPKNSCPQDFEDLRNISCTAMISKIMESFVLEWAMEEVGTKYNQYGGVKGCSGTHMIMKIWQKIMTNLEDRRAATVLTSIDYAKAFNRLSFQHCLAAFAAKGASRPVMGLIAAFLTGRTMKVRVGQTWSDPRDVTGGCPQGSILGVFLFNVTTDDLEEGSAHVSSPGAPVFESDDEEVSLDIAPADRSEDLFLQAADLADDSDSFHTAATSLQTSDIAEDLPQASTPNQESAFFPEASLSPVRDAQVFDVRLNASADFGPRIGRRIVYSSEEDTTLPPEPTRTCLGPWKHRPVEVDKYVDDNVQEEVVSHENADPSPDGLSKTKHALGTQNVFRHIVRRAERKGMRVNTNKTNLLCISDAQNHTIKAFIQDAEGRTISSGDKMKILGWHFSDRPTVGAYVEVMKRRFRQRYWILRHLKHNSFNEEDLVKVYTAMVRPVADYMQEVYHSMLSDRQDEAIERLQTHALKCIYGPRISGRKMREMSGLSTLRERRIEAADKFAAKCASSERFEHWFPLRDRPSRAGEQYVEEFARCDRLYYSPIFYMRRRLNGKKGKVYGKRNEEYRR